VEVPDFQAATITDEMVAKAQSLVGVWLRRDVHWPAIAEPLSQHDIRRWSLYSVGDDNPLFIDADYGRRTVWGGTIAPPTFLYTVDTTIVAPSLPGIQWVYGAVRWEHFKPIRVGDQISARARVIGVKEKIGRHAPRFVVQTGEVIYTNQNDVVVSRAECDILRVPRARSGEGMRGFEKSTEDRPSYSPAEMDEIRSAYLNEERRGAEPRYWEDVHEGDELPLAFLERERHPKNVYVSPETGIPIHPAAGHFDVEIAKEVGFGAAYDQGWMRINWIGHLVTNWCGDMAFVRRLDLRITIPNLVGDLTTCVGRVSRTFVEDGEHLVELECSAHNQRGEEHTVGTAVVRLPSRDVADDFRG
jgi:acyl dehydratase